MPPLAVLNNFVCLFDRSVALNETIKKIAVYIIENWGKQLFVGRSKDLKLLIRN